MRAEVGPNFRLGALKRRSAYNPDGTEGSTARQEDAIFAFVEQHRASMGRIVAVYTDIASAFDEKAKRPEFENALDDLRAQRIDGIIVWKLDRLTRRRSQMRRILSVLEECGGRLVSVVEGIDTADPAKREITEIALSIYIGAAQAESEAISERVRLHHFDMVKKGLVQRSGERPYGLTEDWAELIPAEVKILHEAAERFLADEAGYSIARDFTEREIPTSRGTTHWSSEVLMRMLRSPRMIAMRRIDGEFYPYHDGVPAIFERSEWERVCAKLERKKAAPSETRLLSNIATCDICSNHLRASGKGNLKGKRQREAGEFSYRCRRKTVSRDDGACQKIQIVGSLADAEVSRRTIAYLSERENIERILQTYADKENLDAIQTRVAELTESRKDLFDARFTPPPGMPKLPEDVFYEKLKAVEGERDALMRRTVVTRDGDLLSKLLEVEDVAAEWERRGVKWRRAILDLVVATIVIEARGRAPKGQQPHLRTFDPTRIKIQFVGEVIE
jgi:site-specific DNA recombinase